MPEANQNKLGFGTLNDISKPIGGSRERQSTSQTFIESLVGAAQNIFSLNALSNTGPYKGVVLRIENQDGKAEAGGWLANSIGSLFGDTPVLASIKVRIPEVHAALPIPDQPGSVPGPHQKIIDMYPTFVAQSTELKAPSEGSIVYVDYGSKNTWSDPIYLRPLIETPAPTGPAGKGAAGCHGGPPGTTLTAPTGDSLPGANKAATNSGLPLLKRKAADVESGEYKTIKGEKGAYSPSLTSWEKAIKAAKLPGKSWIGYLHGNDTTSWGSGDSKHKSEDELRDTIIFVPNVTDVSFKEAQVEVIIYLHDFAEFSLNSFEEIAKTLKKMAMDGRNFVLIMPELPWSINTENPQGRTDEGMDEYDDWYDNVMQAASDITGAKFKDGSKKLFVSVVAKNAGAYVIRNSSDTDEFHGTGVLSAAAANRIIMSVQSNISISGDDFEELIDEWAEEVDADKTECAFLCSKSMVPAIKGEVDELKGDAGDEFPHNVILQEFSDQTTITAASLITWINFDKAKAKEEAEAAAEKATKDAPQTDESMNEAEEPSGDQDPADPTGDPPKQPEGQDPPAKDPATPPSETPKKSATPAKKAETFPASVYEENRVKVKDYGSVLGKHADEVLLSIPEGYYKKKQKLHTLAVARMKALSDAYEKALGNGKLKVTSGWRKHKWKSKAQYDAKMIKKYKTVREGRKYVAFNSPHETGLAMDWGNHGLEPKSATISKQKKTAAFAWLKKNAHLFGLTPYKTEPWHWEIKITYDAWVTGKEFASGQAPGSYAVRVGSLGTSNSQVPSGPGGGGGSGGTSGAPCVSSVGGGGGAGGGGPAAAHTEVGEFSPSGAPANVKLISGPTMIKTGKNKKLKKIQMFVIHETGGSPKPNGAALAKKLTGKVSREPRPPHKQPVAYSGVHFWQAQNGDIVQCAPLTEKLPHANWSNYLSVGNEIGCYSTDAGKYDITAENKRGVIVVRPDGKGHITPPGGKKKLPYGGKGYQMPTEIQVRKTWELILWISKGAGGTATGTEINLPIKFPCVPDKNVFYWTRWAGRPERNHKTAQAWWKQAAPEAKFGIVGHHRWNHGDGMFGEFYCLGRAKGFSSEKAYYAAVGAVCTLEKINGARASRHPDSDYAALGKKLMGGMPLNPKYGEVIPPPPIVFGS